MEKKSYIKLKEVWVIYLKADIFKEIKRGVSDCTQVNMPDGSTLHKYTRENGRMKLYIIYVLFASFWDWN